MTSGNVLKGIYCQPIAGIVLRTLIYQKQFSSGPLIQYFLNSTAKIEHLWLKAFLCEETRLTERYSHVKVNTLQIKIRFII